MTGFKSIMIALLSSVFFLHSADQLDFSKKRNFYLGEGEFGSISLVIKNFETFDYQSEIKKPFVMKKINNTGLIELIYDSRTLSGEELSEGKTYSATIGFTKKNIGKKENITLSAVYRPELRILVKDSLLADFKKISFSPDRTADTIKVSAVKNISKVQIDDPKGVIKAGEGGSLSFEKGVNELIINLAKKENFNEEIVLYRTAGDGRLSELYLVVSSTGFKAAAAVTPDVAEADTVMQTDSLSGDSAAAALYADIPDNTGAEETAASSTGFSMTSIIIMSVMGLIILILMFLLVTNRKGALYDKYQMFFEDIATLVKVNPKGGNIDKTIEEIMMILLDKFEYNPGQAENPEPEKKKVLKKPANLKSPGIIQKSNDAAEDQQNIEPDIGGSAGQGKQAMRSDKPLDPKPTSAGDKKISRGFDFLDEEN